MVCIQIKLTLESIIVTTSLGRLISFRTTFQGKDEENNLSATLAYLQETESSVKYSTR